MNTPSPLVPQGTQPPRRKSSLYFKVLMILTVHVVLIGGMLLQGCKDTSKDQAKDPSLTQAGGDTTSPSNSVAATDPTIQPVSTTTLSNQAVSTLPAVQPVTTQVTSGPAVASTPMVSSGVAAPSDAVMGDGKDYIIAKGDTLGAIARRNSISVKALMDANPGTTPKKLRIGQKLQIPASTGAIAATSSIAGPASVEAGSDSATYTVKSGDTLGKIARLHGTSYKKIMAMNDLKTTAIRVGQKLKMPAPKAAGAETIHASASIDPTPGPVSSVSMPATGVAN
jgi:LysM repeat protein